MAERLAEAQRLRVVAPCDGVILAPQRQQSRQTSFELVAWQGTPLDGANRGALLETGTLVCLVGDPEKWEALALVDQQDVALVENGNKVRLATSLYPGQKFAGAVQELSPSRVEELPTELVAMADVPQQRDEAGRSAPLGRIYQARITLDPQSRPLISGATGHAQISIARQSLAERLIRFLASTFRVRW